MLRIVQQSNAAAAKSYHSSAAEYYGAGEQEIVGNWGGRDAERLGLFGTITKQHFDRLCDNRHPFTGERLTARMKANRRVGYDFNFAVCKSLSILYAITGDPAILAAFRWAMNEVMKEMEKGVKVRVRKQGQFAERIVGNMTFAEYLHFTARPVKGVIDPHLHGHCFVPNICWDHVEKMWKALDVASIKETAPHWQEMFQKLLGDRLSGLGYAVEWKGKNWEIAGIGRDTIERFSGRTHQINQVAEKRGITDPRDKDKLGAMTRERKQKNATMPQLRAQWRERLTDEERAAVAQAALKQRRPVPDQRVAAARQQHGHDQVMQRQRIATYERARASYAAPRPASPPPPRQSQSYGR
jgi:conjugative relaxase-like TrwC/TraI family protein